ncbi:TPA: hypothetical protein LQB52_002524 [Enterococcus faecium]|uniref:hypothetical protein n=1 Tax=Enterococcus faecium TaxID=1352 RepID=UPI00298F38A6|nr:hypothetical protein [Enterococcus faecium]MDW7852025.1 hypothetical protein [Enterococcus faecium]HBL3429225.1 hypothetical protein [Enterococcus faecium]
MTIQLDSKRVTDDDLKNINLKFQSNKLTTAEIINDFRNSIVASFNKFDFFNIDLISLYDKVNDKSQFLQETFDDVKALYLNQNTHVYNQIKGNKKLEDILDDAIIYRLATFYTAFLSEDCKIHKTLEILKSEGIKAHVLTSDVLDKKFGIDFILVINNEFPLYFHSINGSVNAKKRLKTKINKQAKLGNITIDRATLFNKKYHKVFVDFTGDYYHFKNLQAKNNQEYLKLIAKNIENQAKCIVNLYKNASEEQKEESRVEYRKIIKYLKETKISVNLKAILN